MISHIRDFGPSREGPLSLQRVFFLVCVLQGILNKKCFSNLVKCFSNFVSSSNCFLKGYLSKLLRFPLPVMGGNLGTVFPWVKGLPLHPAVLPHLQVRVTCGGLPHALVLGFNGWHNSYTATVLKGFWIRAGVQAHILIGIQDGHQCNSRVLLTNCKDSLLKLGKPSLI